MRNLIFLLIFLCNLAFGASQWQGMSVDTLVQNKGAPDVIATASNGNKLYIYTTDTYQSYPASPTFGTPMVVQAGGLPIVTAAPPPTPPQNIKMTECSETYEINKQGIVINRSQKGACK